MTIFCSNPKEQYLAHKKEIDKAFSNVLNSGRYILGQEVEAFEKEFAKYINVKHGVGVGSGTEALIIALRACDIKEGDEVITVSHTAVATVAAIELTGAKVVLVDIESDYYGIDPDKMKKAISPKTKAVVVVHIYGHPVDMRPIMDVASEYGIKVIEDCSQAHGAMYMGKKVGSLGDVSCFSFYPTKNLGAIGDGGMVLINEPRIAEKARLLREYGWRETRESEIKGWNSRLDELQAAVLRIKLKYLESDNLLRSKIADFYNKELSSTGLFLPKCRAGSKHAYHLYVVRSKKRNELFEYLRKNDINALIHYPIPIHKQPAYYKRLKGSDDLPETEDVSREVLSLPMYPELTKIDMKTVIKTIRNFKER